VNEESQIEDMRAALRGDRERAEQARLKSAENVGALTEIPVRDLEPEWEGPASSLFGRLLRRWGTAITRSSSS